jgi:hypothetical protein
MRSFLVFCSFLSLSSLSIAQIGMGQWRMHVPASQAIDVAVGNGLVMTALSGGVLEYDIAAAENRILNNLNALSDIEVTCITYEPQSKSFFVGYANGNLDQITSNGVVNIPAIKLANVTGSKRVNKIVAANGKAYVATGFSVVVIDPNKNEVKDTWYPTDGNVSINDVALLNDSVYVLTDQQLLRGLATNAFLADPSQWMIDPRAPVPVSARYGELAIQQNELHLSYHSNAFGSDSIFKLAPTELEMVLGDDFGMEITRFDVQNDLFYVYFSTAMIAFNDDAQSTVNHGVEWYGPTQATPARVLPYQGMTWVADKRNGLVRVGAGNSFTYIQREGPPKNRFFSLNGAKDKIIVTAGVIDRVVPTFDQPNAYTFQEESWKLFDNTTQTAWASSLIWDIGVAAVYSEDPDKMAIGGYCKDALSIVTNGSQVSAVYNSDNSALEPTTLGNGNVCLSALEYDLKGNLWVVNCYSLNPLKVLKTDGTWETIATDGSLVNTFTGKLAIDYEDNKWFAVYGKGLIGYNGEIDTQLRTGEGNGNLPSDNVTAIAVDRDGEIWIGTDNGFAVLYNANGVFSGGSIDASRILITYEGNVENLLGNTPITDIEIDGGNRKWIATASTGIFLLSPDGQQVLAQYTKENSPLISNNIVDMEFNHISGELFIITDQGLVSLRTDASAEDETYASTTVFPNPVKPDYFGPITIQGIRYDSDVKITDVAGNLVYQTTSNGGTATWNGKTLSGEDVATGVYLIWTATNTGKDRKVGKVAVVR